MKKRQTPRAMNQRTHFPVHLFINTPGGLVALSSEHDRLPLPRGLDPDGPVLTYGPYLHAVANFFCQDDACPLRTALSRHLDQPVFLREIESLEIISQKHGAFYHVAQVRAKVAKQDYSLAVNSAIRPTQQAFLEAEFALLKDLHKRSPLGFVPRAYLMGAFPCVAEDGAASMLKCFVVEWFEGFHEFHLSRRLSEEAPAIRVWNDCTEEPFLNSDETRLLYHKASAILTAYLSPESFSQIYPWHHAAGDFIVKREESGLEVRLVTVRGYQPLVSAGPDPMERWIPLVHFFLNLTFRMRLDRLDGTGDLVWAGPDCLPAVVSGFLEAWQQKVCGEEDLPPVSEVLDVLRSFTPEEWLSLAEVILSDDFAESDEAEFIQPCLQEHATSLWRVIR